MEKFKLSVVALTSLLSTSIAFAGTTLSDFYTTMHPKTNVALKNMIHPPVDVTVINASTSYIYVRVYGTVVHDYLRPGFNDHVYNYDSTMWSVPIMLEDPRGNVFYNENVCRLAIVTVYGNPGNYRINTDNDLCN